MPPMKTTPSIAIVLFDGVDVLDVTGPASVFAAAGQHDARARYKLRMCAMAIGPVRSDSGVVLHADASLRRAPTSLQTLLVPGGSGLKTALQDPALLSAIRRWAARAERVVSVCTGAFLLAEAGLLDGKRVTTHWRHAAELARRYPRVQVDSDAIFIQQGSVWTSAGVTSGLDLALALLEADHGQTLALEVARGLVFYLKRPGGQSQFSVPLQLQSAQQPVLERARRAILAHPEKAWTVAMLAEQVHMSERHLRRLFQQELNIGPRRFIEDATLELAQRLLSDSEAQVSEIARRCGYGSASAFIRRFETHFGVSPTAYRARFQVRATRQKKA